jgi:sporulation protein YlmC with PRC-barrel domain
VAKYAVNIKINEPTGIKVGMTAEATITTEKKENIITVPVAAIQKQGDRYFVLVPSKENETTTTTQQGEETSAADESATTIQTAQQTVEIGIQNDTLVEITSGLSAGDEVVLPSLNSDSTSGQNGGNMFQGGFPGGQGPTGGQGQMERPAGFQGGNRGGDGQ